MKLDSSTSLPAGELAVRGKKYGEIIDYVRNEAEEFVKFVSWAYKELPPLLARFRKENGIE